MKNLLLKLKRDPLGFVGRAFHKLFIAPIKYRGRSGYDAGRYWQDRFAKHGLAMKGVGDEGLSEEENEKMYRKAAQDLLDLCRREGIDLQTASVLEIGCGNGFYTRLFAEQGVQRYVGVDITDIFFPELGKRHPNYQFIRKDITTDKLDGKFNLIIMIDVIEHITHRANLHAAFENVKNHLADGGVFMVAPVAEKGKRSLFYVRFWSLEDIVSNFAGFDVREPVSFRYNRILPIRKI